MNIGYIMVVPINSGGNGLTDCILMVTPVGRKGPEGEDRGGFR